MATSTLPVALPAHWFAEDDWRGVLIHAVDDTGRVVASVTVSEEVRGYLVGVQRVPASQGRAQRYMGRGWRARLYQDALAALMLSRHGLQSVMSEVVGRNAAEHIHAPIPRKINRPD